MTKSVTIKTLFCFLTFIAILSCSPKLSPTETIPAAGTTEVIDNMEASIMSYVNAHRRSMGLKPLQSVASASKQAYLHSKDMATGKTGFGHSGYDQRMETIKHSTGMIYASAENVAYGNLSAKEVVKGWLNSPGHKRNIEGNYTLSGIGVYKDRQGISYFTQIFLRN